MAKPLTLIAVLMLALAGCSSPPDAASVLSDAQQAMGMVNDHLESCYRRPDLEKKRAAFKRPS